MIKSGCVVMIAWILSREKSRDYINLFKRDYINLCHIKLIIILTTNNNVHQKQVTSHWAP